MSIDETRVVRSRSAALPSGKDGATAGLLLAIRSVGLPAPEREYRFDRGCCGHPAGVHPVIGRLARTCRLCVEPHAFVAGRRWRFDLAWVDRMLAVEVDGGVYSGGRHTRGKGFEADCHKQAEAVVQGWRYVRVTTGMVDDGSALEYIERLLGRGRYAA